MCARQIVASRNTLLQCPCIVSRKFPKYKRRLAIKRVNLILKTGSFDDLKQCRPFKNPKLPAIFICVEYQC